MKKNMNFIINIPLWFIIIFFTAQDLLAQEKSIEIFGYFEPQLSGVLVDDEFKQLSVNKLRIDIKGAYSERLTFCANFDYLAYFGATTDNLIDYLPNDVKPPPESLIYSMLSEPIELFEDKNFLDNAFIKLVFTRFDLTAGKQQVSPGAGYAWNPTDILNIKNSLDPTYEQPGQNVLRADIPLMDRFNFMLLYGPERNIDRSSKIINLKTRLGHFDFSFTGGDKAATLTSPTTFLAEYEERKIAGFDIVGELLGIGIWGEAAYNDMELSENYFEGLIGADYTFGNGLHLLTELYRNEQGKGDHTRYDLLDWLRFFSGEKKVMSQDQGFIYINYPASDLLSIGASAIISITDGSMVLVPTAAYNFDDNLDISFFGNIYIGADGKSYSSTMGNGVQARARYYF